MFRQEKKRILGTGFHTAGTPVTEITFKRRLDLLVKENSPKRARDHALLAGDTFFTIDIIDAVLRRDGSRRAVLHAFGYLALSADNGHPYDRVRIDDHHSDGTFFRVVHSETVNGTDQLTNLASGASFRHHGQFPRHLILLKTLSLPRYKRGNHFHSL
jgi:hypothetical protein